MTEREIGAILESLSIVSKAQDRLEYKLDTLNEAFIKHPSICIKELERSFVTIERFEPIETAYKAITAKIWGAALTVGTAIVLIVLSLGHKIGILKDF